MPNQNNPADPNSNTQPTSDSATPVISDMTSSSSMSTSAPTNNPSTDQLMPSIPTLPDLPSQTDGQPLSETSTTTTDQRPTISVVENPVAPVESPMPEPLQSAPISTELPPAPLSMTEDVAPPPNINIDMNMSTGGMQGDTPPTITPNTANPGGSNVGKIAGMLGVLLLVLGVGVGVTLVGRNQLFNQKASFPADEWHQCSGNGDPGPCASCSVTSTSPGGSDFSCELRCPNGDPSQCPASPPDPVSVHHGYDHCREARNAPCLTTDSDWDGGGTMSGPQPFEINRQELNSYIGTFTDPGCGRVQIDTAVNGISNPAGGVWVSSNGNCTPPPTNPPPSNPPTPTSTPTGTPVVTSTPTPTGTNQPLSCYGDRKLAYRNDSRNTPGNYFLDTNMQISPGGIVNPGEIIVYWVLMRNQYSDTTYTDVVPDNMTFMDSSPSCTYNRQTRTVTCPLVVGGNNGSSNAWRGVISTTAQGVVNNTAVVQANPPVSCSISLNIAQPGVAQCTGVKAYKVTGSPSDYRNWAFMTSDELSRLKPGDTVYFTVGGSITAGGGGFDRGQLRINGASRPETTNLKPQDPRGDIIIDQGEYYDVYQIPNNTVSFNVAGRIHHTTLGWIGDIGIGQ